jgi:hypothetical protein
MDSSVSPTHGDQEGTAYNGHFGCTCYHPLFLFNQFGDLERCALRAGNGHSVPGWRDALAPVVARYRSRRLRRYFRADAAFAMPEIYDFLEAEGFGCAIRLLANKVLQEEIAPLLKPPSVARRTTCAGSTPASAIRPPQGGSPAVSSPRSSGIQANCIPASASSSPSEPPGRAHRRLLQQGGTAEQWIKEGKTAIKWTRLSCRRFRDNAVRLQLCALAYYLANFMRTLALPTEVAHWSLTTLREKPVKIGAKVVSHGRYVTFQMAEVAVPCGLFREILRLIDGLRRPSLAAG